MAFSSKKKTEDKIDIIKLVNDIFYQGVEEGASDIHIQPFKDGIIVRYRIDGILRTVFEGDQGLSEFMFSRIKILADMETTGLPRPQEGNIKFKFNENYVDLRVSIFPTSQGEAVVVRILESKKFFKEYNDLGFNAEQTVALEKITQKPYGLILVTGPNGSGKSTTLFTVLNKLNVPEKSLVT